MKSQSSVTRRAFLARSAQVTAVLSLAGSSAFAAGKMRKTFRVDARQLRGLAVDAEGRIAVAADSRILIYGPDGTPVREIAAKSPVRAVGFDLRGRLFVALKDQIARVSESNAIELLGVRFGGRESAITSLALADNGDIFAADSGERLVWRLDVSGKVLGQIKPQENGFAVPRAFFPIAWRDGRLFVADPGRHRIQTYTAEGALVSSWGARSRELEGFAGCCNPVSFAALADGTIVTAERGQPRVKAFSAGGRLSRVLAGPEDFAASIEAARAEDDELFGCQGGLLDVAAAPGGGVVLLDRTTREVRVLA
jgi:hypothetical protein